LFELRLHEPPLSDLPTGSIVSGAALSFLGICEIVILKFPGDRPTAGVGALKINYI